MKKQSEREKSVFDPKHDRLWMLAITLLAFVCCLLILRPYISGLWDYLEKTYGTEMQTVIEPTPEPTFGPSIVDREWDACGGDARELVISATSYERDMTVVVRDKNNNVVTGEQFGVVLTDSLGQQFGYKTQTDGSCCIVELAPGDYTVALEKTQGYTMPESIVCTVKAASEFTPIADISRVIDVFDVSSLSPSEVKNDTGTVTETVVPEIIVTPTEGAYIDMAALASPVPVTDSLGNRLYTYTFHLGSGGCLLYSGTQQESDVVPVDENGDGVPEYGIRRSGEGDISVALFNPDNTPVSLYAIDAVPVTRTPYDGNGSYGWKRENRHIYYIGTDGQREVGLKNIDGKLYYFNKRGEKASSLGIDVSCFNGHIDWNTVKAQGIDFCIIRLGGRGWSTGRVYADTFIQEHMQGAKDAGIKVGVYFYSTAVNTVEAVQEASVVLEKLNGAHLDYPVFIDMEYSGSYPRGRADRLPTAQRIEIANAFCKTVANGGYASGIYASESYMRYALDYGSLSGYTYWLANYTENNDLPAFSGKYDIWQFTNGGQIGGISGYVDMNVIF